MKRTASHQLLYSPSDLVRYLASPFASWMDRYHLESPAAITPDEATDDSALIAQAGDRHEQAVLEEFRQSGAVMVEFHARGQAVALDETLAAIRARTPII